MSSADTILQAEHGPCLHCFKPLELVVTGKDVPCFSLAFLGNLVNRNDHASEDQFCCSHCGFAIDVASYQALQNQSLAVLVTKSFDTSSTSDDDISALSAPTGLPNENIDKEPSHGEEYESLAGLIIAEKYYSETCQGCRTSLSRNWRFCPHCGIYLEETSSSTEASTNGSFDNSEDSFGHLLIDRSRSSDCETWMGAVRQRQVRHPQSNSIGRTQAIFRVDTYCKAG